MHQAIRDRNGRALFQGQLNPNDICFASHQKDRHIATRIQVTLRIMKSILLKNVFELAENCPDIDGLFSFMCFLIKS